MRHRSGWRHCGHQAEVLLVDPVPAVGAHHAGNPFSCRPVQPARCPRHLGANRTCAIAVPVPLEARVRGAWSLAQHGAKVATAPGVGGLGERTHSSQPSGGMSPAWKKVAPQLLIRCSEFIPVLAVWASLLGGGHWRPVTPAGCHPGGYLGSESEVRPKALMTTSGPSGCCLCRGIGSRPARWRT